MADENSTANQTNSITVTTIPDAFFDPAWQLALTVEFYFKYAVLAIGIFGTAANALVLYALIADNKRDTKKRAINLLIINQNLLDLVCCIFLVISICIQLDNIDQTGGVCTIYMNDTTTYCNLFASIINLVILTIERYLKVVHPFWSKKNLKRWMVKVAVVFAWFGGIASASPVLFLTSQVEDGYCIKYFESPEKWWIYGGCNFVLFFLFPLVVFVYCYGRMVVVMRRQMRVMAGHKVEGSSHMTASQAQSKRIKWNIIKTMIIVSASFTVCWFPNNVYFLVLISSVPSGNLAVGYYPTVFLVFLNVCMNPFIYATKHEGVKSQLARLMTCRKPSDVGDASGSSSNRAAGTQQTQKGVTHN